MSDDLAFTEKTECAHCGNRTPMEVSARIEGIREFEHRGAFWREGLVHEVTKCPACNEFMFRRIGFHDGMEPNHGVVGIEILFPAEPRIPIGLPDNVESAFRAALRVQSIDTNAYAVLLGRVVDEVCADRCASGESMFDRLQDLADKKEIPEKLAAVGHKLRKLRNIGAHADLGALIPEDALVLNRLCRALLEYVYSAPALIEQASKKLNRIDSP